LAQDVTFLDGRGGGENVDSDNSDQQSERGESSKSEEKKKDVVIEDIDDEPVNLDDIPF